MRLRFKASAIVGVMLAGALASISPSATATPNLVATDEASYQAFGRVFPDPHGCLAFGVPDANNDGVKDTPRGVSPWAKGRMCADQFLQYQEAVDGAKFLERRFPDYLDVIRLDQAYDNPNYMSAGLPRMLVNEDGKPKVIGRDRRPLYLFKVTDRTSTIPEADRQHFAYSMSIHGIERAGIEGGIRAMEDLVTWAACEDPKYAAPAAPALPPPACGFEGPFPKKIIETATSAPAPTAGAVVDNAVIYFVLPNPDGWARGQVSPVEVEDGSVNTSYQPGFFFQRYNGDGVDLNRDFPTMGYTFKPYSPGSEPETKAFTQVLSGISKSTSAGHFTGGIDLHGMLTANAFSYTLIGAGQRDYRKNALTVDTAIRTWQDQTQRMGWSPYVADANSNGQLDSGETCVNDPSTVVLGSGSRPKIPACFADEWGTVIDTIGYQISGGIGDWFDSPIGLNGIGIDNEMYTSHLAPNTVFEPGLEQTHIDGNKGLIYSQLASLLTSGATTFQPTGKVGYVYNPNRLRIEAGPRPTNPGLPAQNDIEATLPCQSTPLGQNVDGSCGAGTFTAGTAPTFEFQVNGPEEGVFNAGIIAQYTGTNVAAVGASNIASGMQLQHKVEGTWQTTSYHYRQGGGGTNPASAGADLYAPTGQVVTLDDPEPGLYRVYFSSAGSLPGRLKIDFRHDTAEANPGQVGIDASSMDFFDELNAYVPEGSELQRVPVSKVVAGDASLNTLDSLIVVNSVGDRAFLEGTFGLSQTEADAYFANLKGFAQQGGNLVLTDAALQAAGELGIVAPEETKQVFSSSETTAGNYAFQIGTGNVTYNNPAKYPLATDIKKPGAAEQESGRRQAVEPAPLGYSPDYGLDSDPKMPGWGITKSAWTSGCGFADCVTAAMTTNGPNVNLGEAKLGLGTVRIAGILFPDPIFEPDEAKNDHRFGLSDYSLTYTGWDVFENLINYKRP